MNFMKQILSAMVVVFLLSACSSTKKITTMEPSLYQKWDLKVLNGNNITAEYMKPVYVEFNEAESKIYGSGGCNRFFSDFTKTGQSITFQPIGSTKMSCGNEADKFEQEFLQSLAKVNNYKFEDNMLLLLSNAEVIARLEQSHAVPDDMAGTWQLFYITGRRIAFQGLYPDKKPMMTFQTGSGDFSANTSCNSLQGSFNGKKGEKLFNLGAMTLMSCPGEGEQAFVDQLKIADAYQVSGDTLTFLYKDIPNMKFVKTNQ